MLKSERKQDGAAALLWSSSSYFLSRGLEGLLHSGVFTEVTGLLYKQFTWKLSHRECLMKCSLFLKYLRYKCPNLARLH